MTPNVKKIKMIISDVDGVWTDGTFYKGTDGQEFKKFNVSDGVGVAMARACLLYTSPSPRDRTRSRMPSSA